MAAVYGFRYSFSVFYVAILDDFGWDRAATAAILSVNVLVYGAVVAAAGALVDRFGPRIIIPSGMALLSASIALVSRAAEPWHFYLLFGVFASLGMAMAGYVTNFAVLANWFIKRRGTAFGIAQAGNGGSFIIAGIAQALIAGLGWRSAYLVMAIVLGGVITLLTAAVIRGRPRDMGLEPDGPAPAPDAAPRPAPKYVLEVVDATWANTNWTPRKAVATGRFWALFFANLLVWGFGFALVVTHQAAYARDAGHDPLAIALMVSLYGVANIGGNLCGFLSDRFGREAVYTAGAAGATVAVLLLVLAADPSRGPLLLVYSVLLGFGLGLIAPSSTAAHADVFQGPNFGVINGLIVTGFGLGGSVAPWLAGYLYDTTGGYLPAFLLSTGSIAAGCVLMWVARPGSVRAVRRTG